MKHRPLLFPLVIFLLVFCCSCQIAETTHPATSSPPSFEQTHTVSEDKPIVLADVIVQDVYPEICRDEDNGLKYLLANCTIQDSFFISTSCSNYSVLSAENSNFLLWICVNYISEDYYSELQTIITQADSLIIYADDKPAIIGYGGLNEDVIDVLRGYGLTCSITDSYLITPPSLYITDPYCWSLIPIMDGTVAGSSLQMIINNSNSAEMIYDIDTKDDSRISSGDTIEDVYTFLNEYVERSLK